MDEFTSWIGTRWEARCAMRLPKGGVDVGDTFTYDAACAAQRLDPGFWLTVGNAVQLDAAPSLAETVDRKLRRSDEADVKRAKHGGFHFDANPLATADMAPDPAAVQPDEVPATDATPKGGGA